MIEVVGTSERHVELTGRLCLHAVDGMFVVLTLADSTLLRYLLDL